MDPFERGQVEMFINVTGASEAEAHDKLQAYRGDLNAAIDSYLSERENSVAPFRVGDADWMVEDEPLPRQRIVPPSSNVLPSASPWESRWPSVRGFGIGGAIAPRSPYRGTAPIVTQPRDLREIPIDWRDEEPRVRSSGGLLIEEIPATVEASPPSHHAHIITDDEEETTGPFSSAFRAGGESRPRFGGNNMGGGFTARHVSPNAPLTNEGTGMASNEGVDIEDELLRAVIETSQKEITGMGFSEGSSGAGIRGSQREAEEDDFARAVSLSLKTAEQEKALREVKGFPLFSEVGIIQDYPSMGDSESLDILTRRGSTSGRGNFSGDLETLKSSRPLDKQTSDAPANVINTVLRDHAEDTDELEEQPLLRRGSVWRSNPILTPSSIANPPTIPEVRQEPRNAAGVEVRPVEQNGNATGKDEWGGLSSEEQEEAVMLEAAMFGSLPEDAAPRFRLPSVVGGIIEGTDGDLLDNSGSRNYIRPIEQLPSSTVIAQRRLREQQDNEYLASLVADREKEEKAQLEEAARRLKEAEAKAAGHAVERLRQDEELHKHTSEEELGKQIAAKRAAISEEPSVNNENALTIMFRLPDGTRKSRRFCKSETLQCLFDFIDVSCGPFCGSYQLVRPYPRKPFTDADRGSSLEELGLKSKYETLFLELI
eukprot:c16859_g1_i1 orf=207-2174(+)